MLLHFMLLYNYYLSCMCEYIVCNLVTEQHLNTVIILTIIIY